MYRDDSRSDSAKDCKNEIQDSAHYEDTASRFYHEKQAAPVVTTAVIAAHSAVHHVVVKPVVVTFVAHRKPSCMKSYAFVVIEVYQSVCPTNRTFNGSFDKMCLYKCTFKFRRRPLSALVSFALGSGV